MNKKKKLFAILFALLAGIVMQARELIIFSASDIKEMPVTYGISGLNYIKYSTEKVYIDKILKMLIQRTKQFFAEKDLEKTEEKSQINNETKILIRK